MNSIDRDTEVALRKGKKQILDIHGDDPNVTGAGVSYRSRAGKWTDEPVVTVMVAKKRPEAHVSRSRLLPKTVQVDGRSWGVDVVQGGPIKLHKAATGKPDAPHAAAGNALVRDILIRKEGGRMVTADTSLTGKVRPPLQGCSVSNLDETLAGGQVAGTFGCLVRDVTDGTVCVLSCNHVLARCNAAAPNEPIIQPGGLDGGVTVANRIGAYKRCATLANGTEVDAAIAQLDDQTGYDAGVMDGLMAPISPVHPAVGMVVAGDAFGNGYLTRMDATVTALNVEILSGSPPGGGGGGLIGVRAPEVGMNIEKVGRTTGYTTATVLGIGFDIDVDTESSLGVVRYNDLIWTLLFELPGDSGSVACMGGAGNLAEAEAWIAILEALLESCVLLDILSSYYNLPLNSTANHTLADDLRDNFLAQSVTGRLLIAATYVNTQVVIDRLNADTGPSHNQAMAQAKAKTLYSQYYTLAQTLITSKSPTAVVTQADLNTVKSIMVGLDLPEADGGTGILTSAEGKAAATLYSQVLVPTLGMNRQQLLAYMNESSVFQQVYAQLSAVPTIETHGPVSVFKD